MVSVSLNVKEFLTAIDPVRKQWDYLNNRFLWVLHRKRKLVLPVSFIRREYYDQLSSRLDRYKDTNFVPGYRLYESKIFEPHDWRGIPSNSSKNRNKVKYLNTPTFQGECFFCKEIKPLNEEHIPVYSSGNTGKVLVISGINLMESYQKGVLDFTKFRAPEIQCYIYDDGVVERRLCRSCNSKYNYASDYKAYKEAAAESINKSTEMIINLKLPQTKFIGFLKQILSMFLVNCSTQFYDQNRQTVVDYIKDRSNNNIWLPQDSNLWFGIYDHPLARRVGIKSIMQNDAVWYGEVSFAPFIFVLAESKIRFQTLKPISDLNCSAVSVPFISFHNFDILKDAGFNWENGALETFTNNFEAMYYRQDYK